MRRAVACALVLVGALAGAGPARADDCAVAAAGGVVRLAWPATADGPGWPAACAEIVRYLDPPAPPWTQAVGDDAAEALRTLGDATAARCDARGATLDCTLTPRAVVARVDLAGKLPLSMVREQLRAHLRLRPGTLMDDVDAALRAQERQLVASLAADGWFDAHVVATATPAPGLAPLAGMAVRVEVDVGHPAVVGAVRLRGALGPHVEAVLDIFDHRALFNLGPADFRPRGLADDCDAAAALLHGRGYPAAQVRATYHHAPGATVVALQIVADPGPRLVIRFTGAHALREGALIEATTFARSQAVDGREAESSRQALLRLYASEGYDQAQIEATLSRQDDATVVHFAIVEGPRRHIASVEVAAGGGLDPDALAHDAKLHTRASGLFRHGLLAGDLRRDGDALAHACRARGFADPAVDVDITPNADGDLQVRFVVQPGAQRRVAQVSLVGLPTGVDGLDPEDLRGELHAVAGEPLPAPGDLDADADTLLAALTAAGYLDAEVHVETGRQSAESPAPAPNAATPEPDAPSALDAATPPPDAPDGPAAVPVRFLIAAGPRVRAGGLMVRGNLRTAPEVVDHALDVDVGEPLTLPALGATRRHLRQLGIFQGVRLRPVAARPHAPTRMLRVEVEERDVQALDAVLSLSSDDGWAVGADFHDRNVFGHAVMLQADARIGNAARLLGRGWRIGNSDRVNLRLGVPRPWGAPFDAEASGSWRYEDPALYRLSELGGTASLRRLLLSRGACGACPDLTARVGYALSSGAYVAKRADVVVPTRLPQAIIGRVFVALTGEGRDAPLDPRRGYAADLRLELARPALARPLFDDGASFWRALAGGQVLVPLPRVPPAGWLPEAVGGPVVLAAAIRGAVAFPLGAGATMPPSETFAYGGDFSVRGMPPRASSALLLAHSMLTASTELRWYVWNIGFGTVQAAGFVDLGTVADVPAGLLQQTTVTAGPVLRYVTPVGPLAVAYGWPIHAPAALRARPDALPPHGRLHLTLGYAF